MGKLYALCHNKTLIKTDHDINKCKYVVYTNKNIKLIFNINDVNYYSYELPKKFFKWMWDDSKIDFIGNENSIKASFEKIHNSNYFEIWINMKI